MQKICKCGNTMELFVRTIMYSNKLQIDNVPVFSCVQCHYSEILPDVKKDVIDLIASRGDTSAKVVINFEDINELAYLILMASDQEHATTRLNDIVEDRINQLLDLLLIAQSVEDDEWAASIHKRLQVITSFPMSVY